MSENVEQQARELGWMPKEEFKGDEAKWVDAETFVKRGEEIMPLLKATNKRQKERLDKVERELTETRQALATATDAIEALKETTSKVAIDEVKRTRATLVNQVKEAREEGDVETEMELQGKIQEADRAIADAGKPKAKESETKQPAAGTPPPEFVEWLKDNPWYGQDKRRTALAMAVAQEMRDAGDTTMNRAFFDKVTEEVNATFEKNDPRSTPSKVEGGGRGSSRSRGKTYADLPQEAKDACERNAKRLVGKEPGKAFKTTEEWRDHYTKEYFAGEE